VEVERVTFRLVGRRIVTGIGDAVRTLVPSARVIAALAALVASAPLLGQTSALNLTVTGAPPAVSAGDAALFVITVQNVGAFPAFSVTLTDTLPAGVVWTDNRSQCSINADTRLLSCSFSSIAPGALETVQVSGATDFADCGPLVCSPTATASNAAPDQGGGAVVVLCPSLSVRQRPDVARPLPGERLGWRLAVANEGSGIARAVTLEANLAPDIAWSVVPPTAGCSVDGDGRLFCSFGDMAARAAIPLHVLGTAFSAPCGSFTSAPVVTSTNGSSDGDSSTTRAAPSGDANGDCIVTVLDVFHLITFLFAAGPAPI
jgi:uncharacterized repeat protein (TIGR01451 family)